MDSLYQEHILAHYKHPHNKGRIADADIVFRGRNISCGDDISWFVKMDGEKIGRALYDGYGCAISQAGASMLSDVVAGKSAAEIERLTNAEMLGMFQAPIGKMREKCALLALETLKGALKTAPKS